MLLVPPDFCFSFSFFLRPRRMLDAYESSLVDIASGLSGSGCCGRQPFPSPPSTFNLDDLYDLRARDRGTKPGDAWVGNSGRVDVDGMIIKADVRGRQATNVPIMIALRFLPDDMAVVVGRCIFGCGVSSRAAALLLPLLAMASSQARFCVDVWTRTKATRRATARRFGRNRNRNFLRRLPSISLHVINCTFRYVKQHVFMSHSISRV